MRWLAKAVLPALAWALALGQGALAGSRAAMATAPRSSAPVVTTQRIVIVRQAPLWWYDPWWGPAYAYGPAPYSTGNLKIVTHRKDAFIYVDNGYAGLTGKLKKFPLEPGNHTIELRDSDNRAFYHRRVHIIAGKTLELHVV